MLKDRIKGKRAASLLIPVSMSLYAIAGIATPATAAPQTCRAKAGVYCYQNWQKMPEYASFDQCVAEQVALCELQPPSGGGFPPHSPCIPLPGIPCTD
jgi:hypothetical protein